MVEDHVRAAFERFRKFAIERGADITDPLDGLPNREKLVTVVELERKKTGGLFSKSFEGVDALVVLTRDDPSAEPKAQVFTRLWEGDGAPASTVGEFSAGGEILGAWPDDVADEIETHHATDEMAIQALDALLPE